MTWILSICIGVTWAGCGGVREGYYPSEESCYRAPAAMKTGDQPIAESEKKRNTVAFCKPDTTKAKP